MSIQGATVAVVSAGYPGKRRAIQRLHDLGARVVIIDEPGHWSVSLVEEGVAARWLPAPVVGDPDVDARAVLDALESAGERPDGVLTFWEISVGVAARVAVELGLPTNAPTAVDSARSKLRTRQLMTDLGLPSPKARRVRSLDELFAAAQIVGFPAVVKPEFGASAMGCVRVDDVESLPGIYTLVRSVVDPDENNFLRAGNDLLLEEYMDGVEFDVDLVMQDGKCLFSSVSQNWPTAEPSFQETGLHCPADHDRKAVAKLVDLCIQTAVGFGLLRGVLHIEGKCTSRGPRVVEVNTRLGGGRIWEIVNAVWGVDLVEVQLRSCLALDLNLKPARKPLAGVWNTILHAPRSGTLRELPIDATPRRGCHALYVDGVAEVGTPVDGPEAIFSTVLADITLMADDVRKARALTAEVLHSPIIVT